MKVIDTEHSIHCNKIELLDCQVELVLNSLELATLASNFIANSNRKSKSKEEISNIALITNTYEQILEQYNRSRMNEKNKNKKFA